MLFLFVCLFCNIMFKRNKYSVSTCNNSPIFSFRFTIRNVSTKFEFFSQKAFKGKGVSITGSSFFNVIIFFGFDGDGGMEVTAKIRCQCTKMKCSNTFGHNNYFYEYWVLLHLKNISYHFCQVKSIRKYISRLLFINTQQGFCKMKSLK